MYTSSENINIGSPMTISFFSYHSIKIKARIAFFFETSRKLPIFVRAYAYVYSPQYTTLVVGTSDCIKKTV